MFNPSIHLEVRDCCSALYCHIAAQIQTEQSWIVSLHVVVFASSPYKKIQLISAIFSLKSLVIKELWRYPGVLPSSLFFLSLVMVMFKLKDVPLFCVARNSNTLGAGDQ